MKKHNKVMNQIWQPVDTNEEIRIVFYFPGVFVSESVEYPISDVSHQKITRLANKACFGSLKPYMFQFVIRKQNRADITSGRYYINGYVRSFEQVKAENKEDEEVLRRNMEWNNITHVCETRNGCKHTGEFDPKTDQIIYLQFN